MKFTDYIEPSASFSPNRSHRYALFRQWEKGGKMMMVIGLNPSDADETRDDPTIRKCVGFAQRWGYTALMMVNAFAIVGDEPKVIREHPSPIGEGCNTAIRLGASYSRLVVAAWGDLCPERRAFDVLDLLVRESVWCIGKTRKGNPLHPSRTAYTDAPVLFRPARAVAL